MTEMVENIELEKVRNRENQPEYIIDALRNYLAAHHPFHAELRNSFVAV
jgi:hypothetical protein